MASRSHVDEFERLPAAFLTDGLLVIPLFVVTRMSLSERYSMPPVGAAGFRAAVDSSTDTISISALLVGSQRFAWKTGLELLADSSKRGGAVGAWSGGAMNGLILWSRMTLRIDMQVTELSFSASSQRLDTLEVSIGLQHVPSPGPLGLLLDAINAGGMTALEFLT